MFSNEVTTVLAKKKKKVSAVPFNALEQATHE